MKEPVWFARSGAIVVLFSVWSTYITMPSIKRENKNTRKKMSYVEIFRKLTDENPSNESDLIKRYEVPNIIYIFELLAIVFGTIIWAYGDTWLVSCVSNGS